MLRRHQTTQTPDDLDTRRLSNVEIDGNLGHICFLIFLSSLLFSCARSVSLSSSIYNAASTKHYQLAHRQIPPANQEWLALIGEFQRIISADPKGKWADNAQYAIASCWFWLGESSEQAPVDHAINAFNKLLRDYPDSSRAPEAHYWLGHCYDRFGNYEKAAAHYQMVMSRYPNHPNAGKAQLQLGRSYERQRHFTSALATYESLYQRSRNPHIVAQAKKRIAYSQSRQAANAKGVDLPSKENPTAVQGVQSGLPNLLLKEIEFPSKPPKMSKPVLEPSLVQQLGLDVKTIVIDPGHGGKDPGAVRKIGQEKRIVLSLSKMLRDILGGKGYQVRLTREADVYIPLRDRTNFASQHDADLFISIHTNASTNANATGIETYYLALASDESARITAMRENVGTEYSMKELDMLVGKILKESKSTESQRLAQFIQEELVLATQAKNRRVKHAPFVVLIGTKVPAILVEVGFLSNPDEGQKLISKEYQGQLAGAIAEGVEQYIRNIPLALAN